MELNQLVRDFLDKQRSSVKNIYVIGDMLIDEYWQVSVNRINPEAPGIVRDCRRTHGVHRKPGGAANVAYQLTNFNANPYLFCFAEQDAIKILTDHRLSIDGVMMMANGFNPLKQRFIENERYQLACRTDFTEPNYGPIDHPKLTDNAINVARRHGARPDVVVLSDYNKGFFNGTKHDWINALKDTTTIVDPKVGPVESWKGCTIFKPNEKEAYELSGTPFWKDQCQVFKERLGCESVVITRGRKGVVGIDSDQFFEIEPENPVLVESVIGAGDSFVAVLALAVAHKLKIPDAVRIASHAATLYVQNRLNRPLVPAELAKDKIVDVRDLAQRDFKLVFTNGVFDVLHVGHLATLRAAKKQGGKLLVAINSDESVRRLKGAARPINRLGERQALIAAMEMVDFVTSFDEDTPEEIIKLCRPDLIVKGGDYKKEDVVGSKYSEVLTVPFIEGHSSTSTILKLQQP